MSGPFIACTACAALGLGVVPIRRRGWRYVHAILELAGQRPWAELQVVSAALLSRPHPAAPYVVLDAPPPS